MGPDVSIKKEGDMVVQLMWDENHLMIIEYMYED